MLFHLHVFVVANWPQIFFISSVLFLLRYTGPEYCGILSNKKGPFASCHAKVPVAEVVADCLYDVCINEGRQEVLCEALSAYLIECQEAGARVSSWRHLSNCREWHTVHLYWQKYYRQINEYPGMFSIGFSGRRNEYNSKLIHDIILSLFYNFRSVAG